MTDTRKPHLHAKEIIAWADGHEIEFLTPGYSDWAVTEHPSWNPNKKYRVKPQPVIKKMYMHYDSIEHYVQEGFCNGMNIPQQMYLDNTTMSNHLEFTFIDGKLTSVKLVD